jgi:hypothetical protein
MGASGCVAEGLSGGLVTLKSDLDKVIVTIAAAGRQG